MKSLMFAATLMFTLSFTACGGKSEEAKMEVKGEVVDPATAGSISGSIKFSGKAPKRKMIKVSADQFCNAQHAKGIKSEEVVVNSNKTLKNVLVYIKTGLEGRQFSLPKEPATLIQEGCWYSPHVIGVMVNQPIKIQNNDDTLHNIHSMPKTNRGFNFAQPIKGMKSTKSFSKAELVIPVKCDVHPWMGGYIGVLSHPYFAVTGNKGSFSIKNLPPGDYVIEAWHEKYGVMSKKVTVAAKAAKKVNFTYKPGAS